MIVFPNAKINIGLYVTGKREDGFHNLETVFYPIDLCDILELNVCPEDRGNCFFRSTGIPVDCEPEKNLVVKAYNLLTTDFQLPSVQVHLHKMIPLGAGLGGGSSDAAFMLKGVNDLCAVGLSDEQLEAYAQRLGSDCAFFIRNTPVYATGKGEIMETLPLSLAAYKVVVIKPGRGVSTQEAYAGIRSKAASFPLRRLCSLSVEQWKGIVKNDFEESVIVRVPEIAEIKRQLEQLGACYVSMTGSGSAVYALFKEEIDVKDLFSRYYIWKSWESWK